jgi:apolipoprotein D and lipocalin family protein
MSKLSSVFAILFCLASAEAFGQIKTVDYVDPTLYVGTWYQIARNPHPFEKGCVCSRQVLALNGAGVDVYNSCNDQTVTGPLMEIRGTAVIDDSVTNAKLIVDFGLPKKGEYWIIGLDPQYRYAVVSDSTGQSLYVLSKTPTLDPGLYAQAVSDASNKLDTSRLSLTEQNGCTYPAAPAASTPGIPKEAGHPGNKDYTYGVEKRSLTCSGRKVDVLLPVSTNSVERFPAVVYGHGQAMGLEHYEGTMEHLAKKGVAAIFPTYDTGFFDQDWPRMGRDYATLTDCALKQAGARINRDQLIFSGHSKGAYIASIAAGIAVKENLGVRAKSLVLFHLAGYDAATAVHIEPSTAATVIFSEPDTVVKRDLSDSFYQAVKSQKKQFILVRSYSGGPVADHYWPQTKGNMFGGGPEGALHYYGSWKWLVGAALDLRDGGTFANPYMYGAETGNKGIPGVADQVTRNW